MSRSPKRNFLLTKNFGAVLGTFPKNETHRHYTVQLTISDKPFVVYAAEMKLECQHCIIGSNVLHSINPPADQVLLILNVNPFCEFGLWCKSELQNKELVKGDADIMNLIWTETLKYAQDQHGALKLEASITKFLMDEAQHQPIRIDSRILGCLRHLGERSTMPSASEMAHLLNLSESRFLHLFKEETGITYRRMRLWFQLVKSFQNFRKAKTLTELSHLSGFADSAHYSRTFKETFGLSPSHLLMNSSFIQG